MKKLLILAGAALALTACDESSSSTSASGSSQDLGTKVISAKNVSVDEANQTIDITLPYCIEDNGTAVLVDSASGPASYTISNGKLIIDGVDFHTTGTNTSIIGVWNVDLDALMGGDDDAYEGETTLNTQALGIKSYLDIGPSNFDFYANTKDACLASTFAQMISGSAEEEMEDDEEVDDSMAGAFSFTTESESCNKVVLKNSLGMKMTVSTSISGLSITANINVSVAGQSANCGMKMVTEQVSASNCTMSNLEEGNISGITYSNMEYSDDCDDLGFGESLDKKGLAKKILAKIR